MPQPAAIVVAEAVDTTDMCHVRCDVVPSCDTDTLDQQAVESTTEDVVAEAGSVQMQQEHDLWLKAKQQELARLRQQQIVTNKVKTLKQLLEVQFTQRLAVQSQCRSTRHSSGGAVGDIVQEAQGCVGLITCSNGSASASSSSCIASSLNGSSPCPKDNSSSSSSSSDSSGSSAADEAILTDESEDSTDENSVSGESNNCSPADSQPDSSEQHVAEAESQAALDPLQQAALAAAAAALAGITITQASSRPSSSSSSQTKPAPHRGHCRHRNRQPVATGTAAAAPRRNRITAPCSLHSSIGEDPPRSTCTLASSRSASSTMAPCSNNHYECAYGQSSNSRGSCRRHQASTSAAVASADDANAAPLGFGAAVQQMYQARGPLQQQQPAAPPPPQAVAAGPTGPPPPGFAAAVDAPPGFGGMKRVGSGYIQQAHCSHHSPPTASRSESLLESSSAGTGSHRSSNTKPKKVGQSRLFQGALAGAMAERK